MKISKSYRNKVDIYRRFSDEHLFRNLDFSEDAVEEIFLYESKGVGNCNIHDRHNEYLMTGRIQNGYAVGKRMMDITFAMWAEDLQKPGWLPFLKELRKEYGAKMLAPFRKMAFKKSRERKAIFMESFV